VLREPSQHMDQLLAKCVPQEAMVMAKELHRALNVLQVISPMVALLLAHYALLENTVQTLVLLFALLAVLELTPLLLEARLARTAALALIRAVGQQHASRVLLEHTQAMRPLLIAINAALGHTQQQERAVVPHVQQEPTQLQLEPLLAPAVHLAKQALLVPILLLHVLNDVFASWRLHFWITRRSFELNK